MNTPIIAFHYCPGETNSEACLLAKNLSEWDSRFMEYEHWIFELPNKQSKKNAVTFVSGFEKIELQMPDEVLDYPFAAKVFAAAEAEERAEKLQAPQLIWLDPDTLFIQEPAEQMLKPGEKIAVAPVHLLNISSPAAAPIDKFWKLVYAHCQLSEDQIFEMTSIVDRMVIRAHFNAGLIAVNPHSGILRRWRDNFQTLYRNPCMEIFYQTDFRYKVFAHQAILSATILQTCNRSEIKLLPARYNFPLHLLKKILPQFQPVNLDELITVRYDQFKNPGWTSLLPTSEPLQSWLEKAFLEASKVQ